MNQAKRIKFLPLVAITAAAVAPTGSWMQIAGAIASIVYFSACSWRANECRLPELIVLLSIFLAGLLSILDLNVAIFLSLFVLAISFPEIRFFCFALALVHLTISLSLISYLREVIFPNWWGIIALPIAYCGILAIVRPKAIVSFSLLITSITLFTWTVSIYEIDSAVALDAIYILSIFGIALVLFLHRNNRQILVNSSALFAVALVASIASWLDTPPRSYEQIGYFFPNSSDRYEAQFFEHYGEVLDYVGVDIVNLRDSDATEDRVVVLVPWLTRDMDSDLSWQRLLASAREKGWTLIVGGEHSNLAGASDVLSNAGLAKLELGNDLTVPPNNSNFLGTVRSALISGPERRSALNRGARVALNSVRAKPLLIGETWLAEPDIGEPTWVGDYRYTYGDRNGWIVLAALADEEIRWLVVGDNSFLMNRQLIADPRLVFQLLQSASLWPSFLRDLSLLVLAGALLFVSIVNHPMTAGERKQKVASYSALTVAIGLIVLSLTGLRSMPSVRDGVSNRTGFDPTNFNAALVDLAKDLLASNFEITAELDTFREVVNSGRNAIYMGHVSDGQEIAGTFFRRCRRIGGLSTGTITLVDAQVCITEGQEEILIGNEEGSAAVRIRIGQANGFMILDRQFIANRVDYSTNAEWIRSLIDGVN